MHAVYDEKLNIVLWDYKVTTVQTLKITAYLGNDHGSRHFLLNGPKLQNTNCTETFLLAAIMRNQNQTSGRLLANNNNSEGFSNSSPSVVSVSFHQSCPGLDDVRSIENAKSSSPFWTKNLSFEMWQIFVCHSLMRIIWRQTVPLWKPFVHFTSPPTFLLEYSHI